MTTPRIVSLTALAASLLFVVLTIAQANGLAGTGTTTVAEGFCAQTDGIELCATEPVTASLTR